MNQRVRSTTKAFAASAVAALAIAVAPVISQPAHATTPPGTVSAKVITKVVKVSAKTYGTRSYRPVGKLTAGGNPIKGKRIHLQKKASGRWMSVTSCVTNRYGKCAVIVTPKVSRYYRWKFAGDANRRADVSASFYLKKRGSSGSTGSGLDYTYANGEKVYNATSANDRDCGEIPAGKKPVRINNSSDPWRLDRDNDGYGCE
ncbi:excalibur calcium-binding domain-containing protein [Nocardioides sp. YIM B13467]|uniref:excalibur calcium-binding domain-containing protein n=1 Tax=Nocardioides sp. YIM B13467 TaxID=3366294 RepID=UPI00366CE387